MKKIQVVLENTIVITKSEFITHIYISPNKRYFKGVPEKFAS